MSYLFGNVRVIDKIDVSPIHDLISRDNKFVPAPAKEFLKFTTNALAYFGHQEAIYQYPTIELIDFLRAESEGLTIEVGSGNGCIGRSLGVPITDSYVQRDNKEIAEMLRAISHPAVKYGTDVEKLEALEAVRKYKPQTVIGCWVTQKGNVPGRTFPEGIQEQELFNLGVKKYIVVGNEDTHASKDIINSSRFNVQKIYGDWIVSRSIAPKKNVIYIVTSAF